MSVMLVTYQRRVNLVMNRHYTHLTEGFSRYGVSVIAQRAGCCIPGSRESGAERQRFALVPESCGCVHGTRGLEIGVRVRHSGRR